MCGLAGVAAKYITDKHRKIFQELLLGNTLRGPHSTGTAVVYKMYNDKEPSFAYDKALGNPYNLFERKSFDKVLGQNGAKALIGHCRSATIGTVSRSNAHPFMTDSKNIIGAHNGTIRGKLPNQEYYGTDSECLLNNIDEEGIEKVLPETEGAWALTYFDCKDGTLNLIRNADRTLYVATKAKDNEMFWSSEEGLLRWILDRNGVKEYELFLLKQDHLCSISLCDDDPLAKQSIRISVIKGKEESRSSSNSHFPGTYHSGEYVNGVWVYKTHKETATTTQSGKESQTVVPLIGSSHPRQTGLPLLIDETGEKKTESGPSTSVTTTKSTEIPLEFETYAGKKVSKGRFREILSVGCIACERVKHVDDHVHFYADNIYLCDDCENVPEVKHTVTTRIGEFIEHEYDDNIQTQFCN